MNNNYFDELQKQEAANRRTRIPGWVWAVCVLGLVVSILWGYAMGVPFAESINAMTTIPDTDPASAKLEVLDFKECLYVFSGDYYGVYNLIDSPSYASYYDTNRPIGERGIATNRYEDSAYIKTTFRAMSYYDVCCVLDVGELEDLAQSAHIEYSFKPQLAKGNLEGAILLLDAKYTTEENEEGNYIIKPEYIKEVVRLDGTEFSSGRIDYWDIDDYAEICCVFVVGAESAYGTYEFSMSVYNN